MPIEADTFAEDGSLNTPLICLSIDVEWAHGEVLDQIRREIDARGIVGTFFVTHAGVVTGAHEAALHPNFRRSGNTEIAGDFVDDAAFQSTIMAQVGSYAPAATGVRAHSLFSDTTLLSVYAEHGLAYDSSSAMQLVGGLRPYRACFGMLELPIYYMDHIDLLTGMGNLELAALKLDRPGLKVLDFHPNLIFANAPTEDFYQASKADYHDPEKLAGMRYPARGVGDLFLDVLDEIATRGLPTATLAEVDSAWREAQGEARAVSK
jgi:hypothetical protein